MNATVNHPATALPFTDPSATAESWWSRVPNKLLLVGIAVGDALAFYLAAAAVLRDAPAHVVWGLIAATTAAAIATMHFAGKFHRQSRAHHGGPGRASRLVLVATWFALGLGAFWIRLSEHGDQSADVTQGGFDISGSSTAADVPFAVLLLVLYCAGGLVAYYLAFTSYNPLRTTVTRLERRHKALRRQLRRLQRRGFRRSKPRWWQGRVDSTADAQVSAELNTDRDLMLTELEVQAEKLKTDARAYWAESLARQDAEALREAAIEDERSRERADEQHAADEQSRMEREERDMRHAMQREIDAALAILADENLLRARLGARHGEYAEISAELACLPAQEALKDEHELHERGLLEAQAGQLREVVRHDLASALRDPATTSGVFHRLRKREEPHL